MDFISTATELRYYIFREELCVRASDINICIVNIQVRVEDILKLIHHLYLIEQYIVHILVRHPPVYICKQVVRISKRFVPPVFKVDSNDMIICHTFGKKPLGEQMEQQV